MKEIEKLQAGEYYRMDDVEISEIQMRAIDLCQQINNLSIFENKKRDKLLRKLFGSAGKNLSIKPGFLCDLVRSFLPKALNQASVPAYIPFRKLLELPRCFSLNMDT